ncbi:MAG: AI-2E family transporter, partial [Candidatus Faecivicinus sp.]
MKQVKKPVRTAVLLILFAVCANAAVNHLNVVGRSIGHFFGLIMPVALGFVFAFLLSIPVNALEKHLIRPHGTRALKLQRRMQRPLSIVLSIVLIVAIVAFILYTILPNLVESLHALFLQLPGLFDELKAAVKPLEATAPELVRWIEGLTIDWNGLEAKLVSFLSDDSNQMLQTAISVATSVFGKMFSIALALIIAISAVYQKERLARQANTVLYALVSASKADHISALLRRIASIFTNFISGQVLEAFILGSMVFVGMLVFRFPHALAISALVMLMAFLPIIGAWLSAIIGAILILATDGVGKALGFVLMIIILQQIEGNLVYPKVMGKRVGLPSLWVLVAFTLGSGIAGVWGMLLFVPIFAVLYQLSRDYIHRRR